MAALNLLATWDVPNVSAAVLRDGSLTESYGDMRHPFRIASVAKLLVSYAMLVAVEEGTIGLDEPAGPPGSTVRHVLAHASGYGFESDAGVLAPPATRRIYSNRGIETAAAALADAAGLPFDEYQREAVLEPLGMNATELRGSPAHGVWSTVDDLVRFVGELRRPRLLAPETVDAMRVVQFPGLAGVLPGVGRYDPLDWGLGVERNFAKPGHWAGSRLSADTYGHFGGAGTFLWIDPTNDLACVCLTDRDFGPWAMDAWPPLGDALVSDAMR